MNNLKSAKDVLRTYPPASKMMYNTCVRGDAIRQVLVVDRGDGWDFWNNFTHNYHWKKVLTVPYECTDEQLLKIVEDMTGFVLESSLERREI